MDRKSLFTFIVIYSLLAATSFFFGNNLEADDSSIADNPASYIIKSESTETAAAVVRSVGGKVTHEFRTISAVVAELSQQQYAVLAAKKTLHIYRDTAPQAAVVPTSANNGLELNRDHGGPLHVPAAGAEQFDAHIM